VLRRASASDQYSVATSSEPIAFPMHPTVGRVAIILSPAPDNT